MKKSILFTILCLACVSAYAEEHKFMYITDDIFYHAPKFFEPSPYDQFFSSKDGSLRLHYEGWIDSTGTPRCYGRYVEGLNNTLVTGQIKNGIFDGWCTSSEIAYHGIMKWQDSSQTVVPAGWGRCEYPVPNVANQSQPGLVITEKQNFYITEQGEQLNALDAYEKLLYDNNKQYIKKVCAKNDLKYVEDIHLGILSYTGGWKDGQPYLFGAYKDHPDSYSVHRNKTVFCGYFTYDPKDIEFTANNRGSWTEYHHVTYNPFVFRQHMISTDSLTSKQIVTDIEINFEYYTKCISEKGKVKEYEALRFKDGLYSKGTAIDDKTCWGIIAGKYVLYEGMISFDHGKLYRFDPIKYGKYISYKGDLKDGTLKEDGSMLYIKFADGGEFLQKTAYQRNRYAEGEYRSIDGSYIIGLFKIVDSWYDSDKYEPVYAEAYDKNGEIIKSYVDVPYGFKATDIEEHIRKLKIEHKTPICGTGVSVGENYKYEGDLYARIFHGKGKLTYNDGTYKDGTWKMGEFVEGKVAIRNAHGKYTGEFKDGKMQGEGKLVHDNGGYLDGIWNDDLFESGEGYMVYDDGTTFKGTWEHGWATQGTFTAADGSKVVRTWDVTKTPGKTRYGQKTNNKRVDIIYANKCEYHGPVTKGQLVADLAEVVDSVGNRYIGGWNEKGRTGEGTDVFVNGDTLRTTWAENMYIQDAAFTYVWSDGRKMVGVIGKKGKINGVYYNADGNEAPKKEHKHWVMQTPGIIDVHILPVDRRFP